MEPTAFTVTTVVISHPPLSAYCGGMEVWQGLWAGYGRHTLKPPCSWLPGGEELYSAAITVGVRSIGQPFNGEWAALSLAPGGSQLCREGLCALQEELQSAAITYPISERDKLRILQETELAARLCLGPNTCLPCATHTQWAYSELSSSMLLQHPMAAEPSIALLGKEAAEHNLLHLSQN